MRLGLGFAAVLGIAQLSCGGIDDAGRGDPLKAPPGGALQSAPNQIQLYLRFERDQHDLVKVAPGPCG
jgi:hypothetical protein